jgi:S1-C subfamily serine protease
MDHARTLLGWLLCGLSLTAPALAQDKPAPPGAGEDSRLERELEAAREDMEEAAREVARLSAELARPVMRNFRFAGQRAMLGVNIEDTEEGARVRGVSPNGPAATAGLEVGDIITHVDGAALVDAGAARGNGQSPSEVLLEQMANVEPGEAVALRVLRDGEPREMSVQTREFRPGQFLEAPNVAIDPNSWQWQWPGMFARNNPWASMQLVALTPELGAYFGTDRGVLVVRKPANEALGLRDGDVILDIGGRQPSSPEHAMRILGSFEPGEMLRLSIMRRERRETLEITMPEPG